MIDFVYGRISYRRRFSINLPLDSYTPTILDKVISISTRLYYPNVACTKLIYELHVLYRDDSGKLDFLKLDLHDYEVSILFVGDSKIRF